MTDRTSPTAESDEIDRLFSAYFQQQLPKRWPAFQPVSSATPSGPRLASPANRSRATLAIAAAGLLGFALILTSDPRPLPSGNGPNPEQPGLLVGSEADGNNMKKLLENAKDAPLKDGPKR